MSMPSRSGTGSGPLVAGLITVATVAVTAIVLAAAGITPERAWDSFFPPAPVTREGVAIKELYDVVFYIAAVIFFVVEGLIVWTVIRYRRKPGDNELPPQTHGNNLVEVIWTAIPLVIVLVLFVMSWQTLNDIEGTAADETEVRVTAVAAQYQWTFEYHDADGNTVFTQIIPQGQGEGMTIPVGEVVHVQLRSPDVIHAFYVPQFLFKRDVVPGRVNDFTFTAEETGTYRGQCAELCGAFHGSMVVEVRVVTRAEYDEWFQRKADAAAATPTPPADNVSVTLEEEAVNIQFVTRELRAPANEAFAIHFVNSDASVPHNIEIKDGTGQTVYMGEIFEGIAERTYVIDPLPAGTYPFICTVHPNMTGTLTVE
jgi:cytochrome c oxidase subunit 2